MAAGYVHHFVPTSANKAHCKHEDLEWFAGTFTFVPGIHYHKVPELSLAIAQLRLYPYSEHDKYDTVTILYTEFHPNRITRGKPYVSDELLAIRDCSVLDGHLKLTA